MKQVTLSINSVISWVLKILIAVVSLTFFLRGNFLFGGFSLLVLLVSLIPAFVNRSYNTNLPWPVDFWLTLWLSFSVLGELVLYNHFWWWDDFLHFGGTAVVVYLAFVLVFAFNFVGKIRLSIPLIGFATFLIGIAFGALWEMAEFWVWRITGNDALAMSGNFEKGLLDTFHDLHFNLAGASLIALAGMKYVARQRHVKLREWMHPFTEIFGEKVRTAKQKTREKIIMQKKKLKKKFSKAKQK
ncbi:MAG: hypothetical protein ABIH35_03460 [Patescibacteria group bacterium]